MKMLGKIGTTARNIFNFYYEGFRNMTVGRTLWIIILVKLFVFFVILKLFFFPDILQRDYNTDEERAHAVLENLTGNRGNNQNK